MSKYAALMLAEINLPDGQKGIVKRKEKDAVNEKTKKKTNIENGANEI